MLAQNHRTSQWFNKGKNVKIKKPNATKEAHANEKLKKLFVKEFAEVKERRLQTAIQAAEAEEHRLATDQRKELAEKQAPKELAEIEDHKMVTAKELVEAERLAIKKAAEAEKLKIKEAANA